MAHRSKNMMSIWDKIGSAAELPNLSTFNELKEPSLISNHYNLAS